MTATRAATVLVLAGALAVVTAALLWSGVIWHTGTLAVVPFDCGELHNREPQCELPADRRIGLYVQLPTSDEKAASAAPLQFRVSVGLWPLKGVTAEPTLDGYVLKVEIPKDQNEVRVSAYRGLFPVGHTTLRFRVPGDSPAIRTAYEHWQDNQADVALQTLVGVIERSAQNPHAVRDCAQAHLMLGRIYYEKGNFKFAKAYLEQSLFEAKTAD